MRYFSRLSRFRAFYIFFLPLFKCLLVLRKYISLSLSFFCRVVVWGFSWTILSFSLSLFIYQLHSFVSGLLDNVSFVLFGCVFDSPYNFVDASASSSLLIHTFVYLSSLSVKKIHSLEGRIHDHLRAFINSVPAFRSGHVYL